MERSGDVSRLGYVRSDRKEVRKKDLGKGEPGPVEDEGVGNPEPSLL